MMVGIWADRALGRQIERELHDRADLIELQNVRGRPRALAAAEHVRRRSLVCAVLGIEEDAKRRTVSNQVLAQFGEEAVAHHSLIRLMLVYRSPFASA